MHTLKSKAANGIRWNTLNTVSTTTLQIIQLSILGRLLDPNAFGLMAMILVITGLAQVFAEMGLSSAIIQRKDPTRDELSTLYWINISAGLVIYGILFLLTPLIAAGFGSPEINLLLPVAALVFVIAPFGNQFQTLLQKTLRFEVIAKITVFSTFISAAMAVYLAWKGHGVWALVWGSLSNRLVHTALLMIWGWQTNNRPKLHFKWADVKGYLSFGLYRVGAMAINYFNSRVDQLLVGVVMGPVLLGYYNIAIRLVLEPMQRMNSILTSVAFPIFSIVQDDTTRVKRMFIQTVQFLTSVNAPLLLGLASVAPVVIPTLIGEQWIPAVPVVQVLAIYALIRSLGNAGGSLVIAKGKANWTLYWNIALIPLIPAVIYVASFGGNIVHIAFALAGLQLALLVFHYRMLIRKLIGRCFLEYVRSFTPSMLCAIAMSAAILGFAWLRPHLSSPIMLLAQTTTGASVYTILLWRFQRKAFEHVFELLAIPYRPRKS